VAVAQSEAAGCHNLGLIYFPSHPNLSMAQWPTASFRIALYIPFPYKAEPQMIDPLQVLT